MTTTAADSSISAGTMTAPERTVPAHRNATYLRYLTGQALSGLGDQVWYIALSWAAIHAASAGVAGFVLSVSAIPRLALLLFGGVLADRFDIRKLMIGSDILRTGVCAVAALVAYALTSPSLLMLVVLALVFGTVDALFMPAAGAMAPRILTPEQLKGGAVLATLAARIALTVGAPLGGYLLAYGGLTTALAVDAVTFAISVVTLASVKPRAVESATTAAKEPYWDSFRAGLRYVTHHRVIGPLVLVIFLTNAGFVGPLNVGAALLADDRGWGAQGIGFMLTGFGVGAAVGALLTSRLKVRRAGWAIAVLGAFQGVAVFAMALAPNLFTAAVATFVAGVLSGPMAILCSVLNQSETDDAYRGRVSSVITLVALGIVPLAMGLMGVLVAVFGLTGAFAASGAVEAAGLLCLLAPGFRRARTP
jgi:MFS family permease